MKTIIKVANSRGLGIYNYKAGKSFQLVDGRVRKELSFVKTNKVWIASGDRATIVMTYLNRRALEFAVLAMHRAEGFFFIDRASIVKELSESEYHAIINA